VIVDAKEGTSEVFAKDGLGGAEVERVNEGGFDEEGWEGRYEQIAGRRAGDDSL
jgi:hypothetical protein